MSTNTVLTRNPLEYRALGGQSFLIPSTRKYTIAKVKSSQGHHFTEHQRNLSRHAKYHPQKPPAPALEQARQDLHIDYGSLGGLPYSALQKQSLAEATDTIQATISYASAQDTKGSRTP